MQAILGACPCGLASPSAISILKLEQTLGTNLFEREGRVVRLSPDGETLMRHVGLAFDELRGGTESNRGPQLLRLHSAPSFATQWLTPRLSSFLSTHPGVEVRLAASTDYTRFLNDEFDADIVYGPTRAEGVVTIPLGLDTVTPLCAPQLAERIKAIEDLSGNLLIQSDLKRVRWSDWFKTNGKEPLIPHGARFDRSFLAMAVACAGLGIALEFHPSGRKGDRDRADHCAACRARQQRGLHRPLFGFPIRRPAAPSRPHIHRVAPERARPAASDLSAGIGEIPFVSIERRRHSSSHETSENAAPPRWSTRTSSRSASSCPSPWISPMVALTILKQRSMPKHSTSRRSIRR